MALVDAIPHEGIIGWVMDVTFNNGTVLSDLAYIFIAFINSNFYDLNQYFMKRVLLDS